MHGEVNKMEIDKCILENGDCIELLKNLPDNSVDIVIADPPYNISQKDKVLNRKTLSSKAMRRNSGVTLDFGEWDRKDEDEYYLFTETWLKECVRILKPKGWLYSFFSTQRTGYFTDPRIGLFREYGIKYRTTITWHKTNPVPSVMKVNYLSSTEHIVVGSKGEAKIPNFLNQIYMHNFFETPNASIYGETKHPTEKPISLIKWLIKTGSKEGDAVLDPFMGSGTTGIACKMLNRTFIGFELSREYFDIAEKRLKRPVKISTDEMQSILIKESEINGKN